MISGIHPTPKLDETEGFQCLGHSNWAICSPLNPFCSDIFSTFSLSYWEANSYYPRGPIKGTGNSSDPKVDETEAPNSNPGIVTSPPSFSGLLHIFRRQTSYWLVVGLASRLRARATLMANVDARWLEERAFLSLAR